mgnify:CR=1 FL=1
MHKVKTGTRKELHPYGKRLRLWLTPGRGMWLGAPDFPDNVRPLMKHLCRVTFNLWIETIPESKFMWGSDTSGPEAWLGVTLQAKELVAEILCARVKRGLMSADAAWEFAQHALRDNARRFYGYG